MSRYTILQEPHPLDGIWPLAIEALEATETAIDALGSDYDDDAMNAAVGMRIRAIHTIIALPARNVDDTLYKLAISGAENGEILAGCNVRAIFEEASQVLNEAIARGKTFGEAHDGE